MDGKTTTRRARSLLVVALVCSCLLASHLTGAFQFQSQNSNMLAASGRIFGRHAYKLSRDSRSIAGFQSLAPPSRFLSALWSTANTNKYTNSKSNSNSNEYIVQARLAVQNEKRQTRKAALEEDRQRNLKIKRLLHTDAKDGDGANSGGEYAVPGMYAIRVSVDKILRDELKMNGREKRGRVFIECGTEGCESLKGLKFEMHGK